MICTGYEGFCAHAVQITTLLLAATQTATFFRRIPAPNEGLRHLLATLEPIAAHKW